MTTLTELADHHGTDKGTRLHGYTLFYDKLFKGMRSKPVKLLEIGVAGGESILMWRDFFYNQHSRIYGVEIQDKPLPDFGERVRIFITDATSPNAVYDITNATGPLDIIVDDGSHRSDHLKASLSLWWPHVAPGGVMIFEDLHAQYHYPWTDAGEVKFTDTLLPWIDRLNEDGRGSCGQPTDGDIDEILFRKSLLVIRKR